MQKAMSFNNVAIVSIKANDYRIVLMINSNLKDKNRI